MNKHLWVCSYNPHHQIYIRNRIYLKHVMAELRKSSLASVWQDFWKHQAESCLLLVNQDCCWKKTKQPSSCFFFIYSYVFRIQRHHGWPCQHSALWCCWQDRSVPICFSSNHTAPELHRHFLQIAIHWDNLRWRLVWETTFSPGWQAQLPWAVTVPPVSWQNPTCLFHSDSYHREVKFVFFPLAWNLSQFVFKKQPKATLQKNCIPKNSTPSIARIMEAAQDNCWNLSWTNLLSRRPNASFCLERKWTTQ